MLILLRQRDPRLLWVVPVIFIFQIIRLLACCTTPKMADQEFASYWPGVQPPKWRTRNLQSPFSSDRQGYFHHSLQPSLPFIWEYPSPSLWEPKVHFSTRSMGYWEQTWETKGKTPWVILGFTADRKLNLSWRARFAPLYAACFCQASVPSTPWRKKRNGKRTHPQVIGCFNRVGDEKRRIGQERQDRKDQTNGFRPRQVISKGESI